jgi:hypothetical protein
MIAPDKQRLFRGSSRRKRRHSSQLSPGIAKPPVLPSQIDLAQQPSAHGNDLPVGGNVTSQVNAQASLLPQYLPAKGWADYFIIGLVGVGLVLAVVWDAFLVALFIKLLLWLARWG